MQVRAGVGRWLDRLEAPLQQPLRLGEGAFLLGVVRRREEEDLRADLVGLHLAGSDLGAVLPPRRGLDQVEVTNHQPLEVRHPLALHAAVRRADSGVLAEQEVSLDRALDHVHDRLVGVVVPGQPRQIVVAEIVLRLSGIAPPCLQQTDHVGIGLRPKALLPLGSHRIQVLIERLVLARHRHRQVAGQQVEQRRDITCALDRRVATQRHDAAARPPDVTQQQLQDGCGADELGAERVLGPAHRVGEHRRPLPAAVVDHRRREVLEVLAADAARIGDHLRGVPGVVPLQDLEHGLRMLQGLIALDQRMIERCTGCAQLIACSDPRLFRTVLVRTGFAHRRLARPLGLVRPGSQVVLT